MTIPSALAKERKESKTSYSKESSKKSEDSHEDDGDHEKEDGQNSSGNTSQNGNDDDGHESQNESESKNDENEGGESGRGRKPEGYRLGGDGRGDKDDRPPRTLVEMLRRMTDPRSDKPASRHDDQLSATQLPRGHNEILALDMTPESAARARRLGFEVRGSMQSGALHGRVTRLAPPPGMDAGRARGLMDMGRPGERFAVNQRYVLYHLARKEMSGEPEHSEPARRGKSPCTGDRCFATQTIGWHSEIARCAKNLRVGVIDTQVDSQHPAFTETRMQLGVFLPEGAKPATPWHGTGVLSVLAGAPDSGTPGLIPQADFYVASVFSEDDGGEISTDTVSLLGALEWMSAFDVKIVNMSFSGPKDDLVEKAIERMSDQGVQFVAAVGNDGPSATPSYPASYSRVVAVTAVGKDLRNYPYANRGDRIDFAAPGVDIWTAVPGAREGYHTGTSFAAPYVTAMLAALHNETNGQPKQDRLDRLAVVDLGPAGRDPIYGRGLMVAPAACADVRPAVAQDGGGVIPAVSPQQAPPPISTRTTPSSGPAASFQ